MIAEALRAVRFDEPQESEFRAHFEEQGRKSRAELWIVLLVSVAAVVLFHRVLLKLPPEVVPLGKSLIVGVAIPALLRGLSVKGRPFDRWSTEFYILAAFIDLGCILALRVVTTQAGYDVVPLIIPTAILMSLIVVQIRFLILVPAVLAGLAGILCVELLAFELSTTRAFGLMAVSALVLVALMPAFDIERWMRRAWMRQQELNDLAELDELTGLATRRSFETRFQESIRAAKRARKSVTLMIVDIDHFKAYNDHFGHPAGDRCLNLIGNYLKSAMRRPQDFAARLGGEEFAVVWFDLAPEKIQGVADALLHGIAGLHIPAAPGRGPTVTASGGIVQVTSPDKDLPFEGLRRTMMERADKALYAAKRAGRNRGIVSPTESDEITRIAQRVPVAEAKRTIPGDSKGGMNRLRNSVSDILQSLRFTGPLEAKFRESFEQQGRSARRLILIGLLAAFIGIIFGSMPVLTPEQFVIGTACLLVGMTPPVLLALLGTSVKRLMPWSAVLYIGAVWLILTTQMFERKFFLDSGQYDLVPFLMPVSVLLSLSVVHLRFAMLAPSILVALGAVVAFELWAFEMTSYRLLDVLTAAVMVLVTLSFSYKLERYTRIGWEYERRLDEIAHTDVLTGLPNRRMFDMAFIKVIRTATREKCSVSLMIMDIDHFKPYNDHYGHLAGDACLEKIGKYLSTRELRPLDFSARIGGEEFALVWFDARREDLARLADNVRRGVASLEIPAAPDIGGHVTASAGLVYRDAPSTNSSAADVAAEMVDHADQALYRAKRANRDRVMNFSVSDLLTDAP